MFTLLLASCSSENTEVATNIMPLPDYTWEEEDIPGASATIPPFTPGNELTRSTYVYRSQKMVFGWEEGDKIGLFPTAKKVAEGDATDGLLDPNEEANRHPAYDAQTNNIWRTDPAKAAQRRFVAGKTGSQTTQIFNNDEDFVWDDIVQWTAYFPFKNNFPNETYAERKFSFENQTQEGMVDLSAYRNGKGEYARGDNNPFYMKSEEMASKHLGSVDYLISSEMAWNGDRINFQLRHVGAVIRLYLKAPEDNYVITKLQLICESPIFYEKGKVTMISHPYKANEENYGVDFNRDSPGCQIQPIGIEPDGNPSKNLTLNFYDDDQHQKALSIYDAADQYKRYIIAYIMTYPITYDPDIHGHLYAYVTAYKQGDASKKEHHFVSNAFTGFNVESGHYYQLSSATHPDDGFYPIELTATDMSWTDIVGAAIDIDLEK